MFPKYEEVEFPLFIEILKRNGTEPKEVYAVLANRFKLTKQDLDKETKEKEPRNKWENIIRFAVKELRKKGLVDKSYGVWRLTDKGYDIKNGKAQYPITENLTVAIEVLNKCLHAGVPEAQSREIANLTIEEIAILLPQRNTI